MPDTPEGEAPDLVQPNPGLMALLEEARQTWIARAGDSHAPGWRPFEDAFPTFYQFTNRPRGG